MIEEIYRDKEVFRTVEGDFYRYQKHEGEYITSKARPKLENKYLKLYEFVGADCDDVLQIMMEKKPDGTARPVTNCIDTIRGGYEYKLFEEDFAFGYRDDDRGDGSNSWGHWFMAAKNNEGKYENITLKLHSSNWDIDDINMWYTGVLVVDFHATLSDMRKKFFVKEEGKYQSISEDEADKITPKDRIVKRLDNTVPLGWKKVSNLGGNMEKDLHKMLRKKREVKR